jgi:hypothetical protein
MMASGWFVPLAAVRFFIASVGFAALAGVQKFKLPARYLTLPSEPRQSVVLPQI